MTKTGILLLNLGTPDDTSVKSVRRYLRQFLSDPRVIDIPALGRWALLNLVILPFRPAKSAEAYRQIWSAEGSPLLIHTRSLCEQLQALVGPERKVRFAMRYQNPSMTAALDAFQAENVERLIVVPLYPQYASSSTGSCLEELYRLCGSRWNVPHLAIVPPFYDHPAFIEAEVAIAREHLGDMSRYDYLLMSFHGLPERQVTKTDPTGSHCLAQNSCCDRIVAANRYCYRAQCYASARLLAERLGLGPDRYGVSFQSRLGRTPWIRPYTDHLFEELPAKGIKRLAVMIPSFTADCLETLEEIDIRGRESFLGAGGTEFTMVPSLNSHPAWVRAVAALVDEQTMFAPS